MAKIREKSEETKVKGKTYHRGSPPKDAGGSQKGGSEKPTVVSGAVAGTIAVKSGRAKSSDLTAVFHKEGKWVVSYCPEIGTTSQGKTQSEALENLKEATALYLEEFPRPKYSTATFRLNAKAASGCFRQASGGRFEAPGV